MLEHGGYLLDAIKKYHQPKEAWLDLSTGINPNGWRVPSLPAECWQRLPEHNDELISAAKNYYQTDSILAVAGSQAAIQCLPLLFKCSKVGVLYPAYAEHAHQWQQAGHQLIELSIEEINSAINGLDILILVNPNNPTGHYFSIEQLLDWHYRLNKQGGYLIIDEAFIDSTLEYSLSNHPVTTGLIILRSIGKFFGLAGIRCGFVIAPEILLHQLNERLGVWAISHPSRYIAMLALQDRPWQINTVKQLKHQSTRLALLLSEYHLTPTAGTDLFQWVKTTQAADIYQSLAKNAVLVRLFHSPASLRFGLPKDEPQWQQLTQALKKL